jgi:DNA-binding NarL/FixJ family response regulator
MAAIAAVNSLKPDIVLMDISMPKMTGIEATRQIKALHPQTRVLMLTIHKSEDQILESFNAGADGYVLKHATREELLLAIKSVHKGESFISPMVSHKVIDGFLDRNLSIKQSSSWETLTPRERQILKLVAEGHTNKKIADSLFISVKTVETHRSNIMSKLAIHNVQELTAYAMRKGLLANIE